MLLNRANKVLGLFEVSTVGISGTVADPRINLTAALKGGVSGISFAFRLDEKVRKIVGSLHPE